MEKVIDKKIIVCELCDEVKYLKHKRKSLLNGHQNLNLEKIENMIIFFVENCDYVFKTKLNPLLWYADFCFFKAHGKGITGLIYIRSSYGATPEGLEELLEIFTGIKMNKTYDDKYDVYYYQIEVLKEYNKNVFSVDELEILEKVASKFKDIKSREICKYIRKEKGWKNTKTREIIKYSFGVEVREF